MLGIAGVENTFLQSNNLFFKTDVGQILCEKCKHISHGDVCMGSSVCNYEVVKRGPFVELAWNGSQLIIGTAQSAGAYCLPVLIICLTSTPNMVVAH